MTTLDTLLDERRDAQLAGLAELVRFPSVSADRARVDDLRACATWLGGRLEAIGLEHVQLLETGLHPVVYADWLHAGPDAPTVLLYGHYDVQPAEPLELWESPPFDPELRDGRLYGRGASDCKGNVWLNVEALAALLEVQGALPVNLKVIVEGEEELRPEGLQGVLREHAALLAADVAVICDSSLFGRHVPSVATGLRGMASIEVTVRTLAGDLHSGLYGGIAPNALHAVAHIVDSLRGPDGRIAVEGFYDRVREPSAEERAAWAKLPFDADAVAAQIGARELIGEPEWTPLERSFARPTLDVHGLWGGFQDPGVKTIIPAEGHIKLSCRLVPDQDAAEVVSLLRAHVERHAPPWAQVRFDMELAGAWPIHTPADHPAVRAALGALGDVYDEEPVTVRSGWSVPVVAMLDRELGLDSVLFGFGLPTDNLHAPNEHMDVETFHRGVRAMTAFWPRLAAEWAAAP
jgi:acetylornithine deacetylase/succinyl-diaminopimelate desuccinylase-like protein